MVQLEMFFINVLQRSEKCDVALLRNSWKMAGRESAPHCWDCKMLIDVKVAAI